MELGDYFSTVRKHWVAIAAIVLLAGGAAFGFAKSMSPSYRGEAKVFASVQQGTSVVELLQGANFSENLVQSYAQIARMPVVLDPVIAELGLDVTADELASRVTTESPINTAIVEIRATDGDPVVAADLANAIAAVSYTHLRAHETRR